MQNKSRFFVVLVLMLSLMIASISAQEAVISVGDTVAGEATNAQVEYDVELSEGQSVLIELVSSFGSKIIVRNASGSDISTGEGGGANFNDTRALFIAPDDGTYTVIVASRFGNPSGDYTLSVVEQEVTMLTYGETLTTEDSEGSTFDYYIFEGSAGDIVNIFAFAFSTSDALRLALHGADGQEIVNQFDGGVRGNPYIRRQALPEDGVYAIYLQRTSDRPMVGNYEITVEATEELPLLDNEYELDLGDDLTREFFTFNARSGNLYTINLNSSNNNTTVYIEIRPVDSTRFDNRWSSDNFVRNQFTFRAASSGLTHVILRHTSFSRTSTYTISMEPAE